MPPQELQWLSFSDFTPGIRQKIHNTMGEGSKHPIGSATVTDTYRCIALPDGGLGPLPKRTVELERTGLESNITRVYGNIYGISGLHVTGPILASGADGIDQVEIHIAYDYEYDSDGNGSFDQHKYRWERFRVWEATPTIDTIYSATTAIISGIIRRTNFTDIRMHPTDATQIGYPLVAAAWYEGGGGNLEVFKVFPDPNSPGANGVLDISTTLSIDRLVQHQGRLVAFEQVAHQHGNPGTWSSDEQVWWTEVNSPDLATSVAAMFGQGRMTGYGAAGSVSAQELLLVKHFGGALSIQGDLDRATVISLPGVMSTKGADVIPVYTPVGLVYAVQHGGIYAWQGGDTSEKLSTHLEDDFWRTNPHTFIEADGKFDVWDDWILVTNNFLYDTVTRSWWKLEDEDVAQIFHWAAPPQNEYMYGAPYWFSVASPSTAVVVHGWDKTTPAENYSWRSNYFSPAEDRVVDIREIVLEAVGDEDETVVITLINEDGTEQSETFTITHEDIPGRYRKSTNLQGSSFQLKIVSDGSNGGNAAPVVFKVGLGFTVQQRLANG